MRIQQALIPAEAAAEAAMEQDTVTMPGNHRQVPAQPGGQKVRLHERKSKPSSTLQLLSMRLARSDTLRAGGTSQSGMSRACEKYSGQATPMTQNAYIKTCKSDLPEMGKKILDIEQGGCLGLSTLWLRGRHSGMDDKTVISQMLGYAPETNMMTSAGKAQSGIEMIHQIQETFQNKARIEGQYNDPRFDEASAVIRRYDIMRRVADMARMPLVPVRGEVPFVLLQRAGALGDSLSEVLHAGHEQMLWVQSDEHAMAIYANGRDQFAFYDPDSGIFNFSSHDKFIAFMNEAGNMIHPSYSRRMSIGGPDVLLFLQLSNQ